MDLLLISGYFQISTLISSLTYYAFLRNIFVNFQVGGFYSYLSLTDLKLIAVWLENIFYISVHLSV
jgi:hypothetical protein